MYTVEDIKDLEHEKQEQTIFDIVATHLLTQYERSVKDEGGCMYRGKGNTKCALGCLIPDHLYHPELEDQSVHALVYTYNTFTPSKKEAAITLLEGLPWVEDHVDFLLVLQSIHDDYWPEEWVEELVYVAKEHGLDYTAVIQHPRYVEETANI